MGGQIMKIVQKISSNEMESQDEVENSTAHLDKDMATRSGLVSVLGNLGTVLYYTMGFLHPTSVFSFFTRLLQHLENLTSAVSSRSRKRRHLLAWIKDTIPQRPVVEELTEVWRDGALLCALINSVVPGACLTRAQSHTSLQHGQDLANRYLGVTKAFSDDDFQQVLFTSYLERRLVRYLCQVKESIEELRRSGRRVPLIRIDTTSDHTKEGETTNPNGCIVKGMGLVVAVQNRRATFYIYPRFPQQPSDFFIEIKGPSEDFGSATISIGSNLSQMSTISKQFSTNPRSCNIVVSYKVNNTYVRVTYVPCSDGPHELSVLQNEKHVVGSPYHIVVDKSSEESLSSSKWKKLSEEEEDSKKKITRRRLRVLMKVVDFVTEKMILTEDGRLQKLASSKISLMKSGSNSKEDHSMSSSNSSTKVITPHNTFLCKNIGLNNTRAPSLKDCKKINNNKVISENQMRGKELFQDRCRHVVKICNFVLTHSPKQRSLEIITMAEHILDGRPVKLNDQTLEMLTNAVENIQLASGEIFEESQEDLQDRGVNPIINVSIEQSIISNKKLNKRVSFDKEIRTKTFEISDQTFNSSKKDISKDGKIVVRNKNDNISEKEMETNCHSLTSIKFLPTKMSTVEEHEQINVNSISTEPPRQVFIQDPCGENLVNTNTIDSFLSDKTLQIHLKKEYSKPNNMVIPNSNTDNKVTEKTSSEQVEATQKQCLNSNKYDQDTQGKEEIQSTNSLKLNENILETNNSNFSYSDSKSKKELVQNDQDSLDSKIDHRKMETINSNYFYVNSGNPNATQSTPQHQSSFIDTARKSSYQSRELFPQKLLDQSKEINDNNLVNKNNDTHNQIDRGEAQSFPSDTNNVFETFEKVFPCVDSVQDNNYTDTASKKWDEVLKFNMWPSDIEFGTANTQNNFNGLEVDFDSIISAPNLEEALKKLEQGLQKGKEIQNNVLGSNDYNNLQLKDDKNKYVNNDQIQQQNEVEEINEFLQQYNDVEEINEFVDIQEGEVDFVYNDEIENVYFGDQVNHADIDFPEEDEHYNNLNIDLGDSDYVSCEDIHRSPHKTSELLHIIERVGNDINNRKHEESSRYSDKQGNSETTFFLGPAEREIWGTSEEKNVHIGNKEVIEADTTFLNIRHYPRVLTPGVPTMSAITEESENSKIYLDFSEKVTSKESSLYIPKVTENEQDIDYHECSIEGNNIDLLAPKNSDELVSCSNLNQIDEKLKSNINLLGEIQTIVEQDHSHLNLNEPFTSQFQCSNKINIPAEQAQDDNVETYNDVKQHQESGMDLEVNYKSETSNKNENINLITPDNVQTKIHTRKHSRFKSEKLCSATYEKVLDLTDQKFTDILSMENTKKDSYTNIVKSPLKQIRLETFSIERDDCLDLEQNIISNNLTNSVHEIENIEKIENVKTIHQAADIDVGSYHAKMIFVDNQNCPEIKPEEFPKIIVSDNKSRINEGHLYSGSATSIPNVKHKKSFWDEMLSSPLKGKDSIKAPPKPKRLSNKNLEFAKDGESVKKNHRSRRHPSILIPGIVSKWKRCFENKNGAPSIGERKYSRQTYPNDERAEATNRQNMVSQWKQFWDELLINQIEKQHTSPISIKNKDEEKPLEALKQDIVASSRQVFEKQTGAFKTETIKQIKSVTKKSPSNRTIAYDPLVKYNIVSEVNSSVSMSKIESMDTIIVNSKSCVNKDNSSLTRNSNKRETSNQTRSFQNTGLNGHGIEGWSNLKEKEVCSEKLGSYTSETFNYVHFAEPMKKETDESTCDDPSVQMSIDQSVPEQMNPEDQELSLQNKVMSGSSVVDAVLPACPRTAVVLCSYSDKKDDITSKNTEKIRERYEQAKSFFQKLESQCYDSTSELTGSHPRVSRSVTSTENLWEVSQSDLWDKSVTRRHKVKGKKKEPRGVRSAPASDTETVPRMDRGSSSESELGGSERCKRVSERFHVRDLFIDVAGEFCGGSVGHGVPHREAVLAALRSVEEDLDRPRAVSSYEYTHMMDKHYGTSIATCPVPLSYQPEFPYLSNTPPNLYRSRSDVISNRLIPRTELFKSSD